MLRSALCVGTHGLGISSATSSPIPSPNSAMNVSELFRKSGLAVFCSRIDLDPSCYFSSPAPPLLGCPHFGNPGKYIRYRGGITLSFGDLRMVHAHTCKPSVNACVHSHSEVSTSLVVPCKTSSYRCLGIQKMAHRCGGGGPGEISRHMSYADGSRVARGK